MQRLKPLHVDFWEIPKPGEILNGHIPLWVGQAMFGGDLDVNNLGGVTLNTGRWSQVGLPGDVLVRYKEIGQMEVIDKDQFPVFFEATTIQ